MSWLPCKPDERIGEILVRNGYIRAQDLEEALAAQQARGGRIGEVLIQLGRITADHLHLALAEQFKVPHMELTEEMIDDQLWELADPQIWRSFRACPVLEVEGELVVVLAEPPSADRVGALSVALGRAVRPTLGSPAVVDAVIARRTGAPVALGPDGPIAVESAEHEWIDRALRVGAWGLEVRCDGPRIQVRQLFRDGASRPLDLPPEETAAGVCELLAPLANQVPRAPVGPGEAVVWSGWVHRRIAARQLLIQIRRLRAGGCDWSRFTWLGPVPPEPPPEPVRQVLADLAGRTGGLIVAGGRHPPDTEALLWWLGEHLSGDPLHISGGPPAPGESHQFLMRVDPGATAGWLPALRTALEWTGVTLVLHEDAALAHGVNDIVGPAIRQGHRVVLGLTAPGPERLPLVARALVGGGADLDPAIVFGAFPAPACLDCGPDPDPECSACAGSGRLAPVPRAAAWGFGEIPAAADWEELAL